MWRVEGGKKKELKWFKYVEVKDGQHDNEDDDDDDERLTLCGSLFHCLAHRRRTKWKEVSREKRERRQKEGRKEGFCMCAFVDKMDESKKRHRECLAL